MSTPVVGIRINVEGGAQAAATVRGVASAIGVVDGKIKELQVTAVSATSRVGQLIAALGVGLSVREFIQQADTMSLLDARLKVVVGTGKAFRDSQAEIYRIAQANNIGLQEATQLYIKLADPVKRLGGGVREVGGIVDAFAMSIRLGGASSQEAASATLQFAQAMASGKLSGDEFRAMSEASPRFMQALADGMNVPVGKLKEMGSEGKLTADVVGNALVKSLGQLKREAQSLPDTVGGAITRLKNDITVAIGVLNEKSGLTLGIASLVESVRTEVVPAVRNELGSAFESVSKFINDNREQLAQVWNTTKGLAGDVWEVAKAAGRIAAFVTEWRLQSGGINTALEAARLLVAGLQDGVTFLSGVFAGLGSLVLQFLVYPLTTALELSGLIAGVFDKDLGAQIANKVKAIEDFARAGSVAAAQVFDEFARGDTETQKLSASLQHMKDNAAQLDSAMKNNTLSTAETSNEMARLASRTGTAASGYTKLKSAIQTETKEQKEAREAYEKVTNKIEDKTAAMHAELLAERELTAMEKLRVEISDHIARGLLKVTDAQQANIDAMLETAIAAEQEITVRKALQKAAEEEAKTRASFRASEEKAIEDYLARQRDEAAAALKSVRDRITGLEDEGRALALSRAQNISLAEAVERVAIARLQEKVARLDDGEERRALEREIVARKELLALVSRVESRKAADAATDEWVRATDQIRQSLSDCLYNAFEDGRGFFVAFWSNVKNAIKSTVLRVAVDATAGSALSAIGGAIGIPGLGGSKAGGVLGGVNTAASGYSAASGAYNVAAGLLGYGGSTAGAAAGTVGYANAVGALGGDSLGALIASNSAWGGVAVGGTAAGGAAGGVTAGAVAAEGGAAAAGGVAGAEGVLAGMGPYGWIALAVIAVAAYFGLKKGETPHFGSVVTADDAGVRTGGDDPTRILDHFSQPIDDGLKALATASRDTLQVYQELFGGAAKFSVATKFASDNTDASFGAFAVSRDGAPVSQIPFEGADDAKAYDKDAGTAFAAFAVDVGGTVREALNTIDLPGWVREQLNALGDTATIEQLNALAGAVKQTFDTFRASVEPLGGSLTRIAGLSYSAVSALAEAAGGLDNLKASLATYYTEFFSQNEKQAAETQRLTGILAEMGFTLPTTRDGYRALVEAQDLNTTAGAAFYAELVGLSGAFASLVPAAEAAAVVTRTAADIARERYGLETEQLRALGDTATLRERELSALDESNRELQRTIWALQDAKDAAGGAADSIDKMASAAGRVTGPGGKSASATDFAGALMGVGRSDIEAAVATMGSSWQFYLDNNIGPSLGALANSIALGRAAGSGANAPPPTFLGTGSGSAGDAAERQVSATEGLTSSMNSLRESLSDYLSELTAGDLSILSPEQKYAAAKAGFGADGAVEELNVALLREQANLFLKTSREQNASGEGYVSDFQRVVDVMKAVEARLGDLSQLTASGNASNVSALNALINNGRDANGTAQRQLVLAELERQSGL